MSTICGICGNEAGNKVHLAREMMFGTRETFEYIECFSCGTLHLKNVPELGRHYPPEYYSLDPQRDIFMNERWRHRVTARFVGRHFISGGSRFGRFLAKYRPTTTRHFPHWLRNFPARLTFDDRILDFGSGSGTLLRTMRAFGFRNLTGADAFIPADISDGKINILRRGLEELDSSFDLVMLHHVFEHLPHPREALKQVRRILSSNGHVILRVPIVNYAWEKYGTNWVQLDPPRHLFLYTESSIRTLFDDVGFSVVKTLYDSNAFQFYGSEQYLMDIPMNDENSFFGVSGSSLFSQEQMDEWSSLAAQLNAGSRGDQACFYLRAD